MPPPRTDDAAVAMPNAAFPTAKTATLPPGPARRCISPSAAAVDANGSAAATPARNTSMARFLSGSLTDQGYARAKRGLLPGA